MSHVKYLSIPYKHLGRSFAGCDCLGLVALVYKEELGIDIPIIEYNKNWYVSDARKIIRLYSKFGFSKITDTINRFDVLLLEEYNYPKHLAIALDEEYMIHTTEYGTLCETFLQGKWYNKIHSIYRKR